MAGVLIGWGDGTTGKIEVAFTGEVGTSLMLVSSSPNQTLRARQKTLLLKSTTGLVLGTLVVSQAARSRAYQLAYNPAYK